MLACLSASMAASKILKPEEISVHAHVKREAFYPPFTAPSNTWIASDATPRPRPVAVNGSMTISSVERNNSDGLH